MPLDVRNRAWFYLAKVWYQRNYLQQAADALASIRGALPGDLEPERHLLEAQVLMYLDRYDDAIRALERWQPVGDGKDAWSAYARFNIGVALVRKDRLDDAAKLLDAVGQIDAPTEELAALRDKANLALGFAWLKADRAGEAKTVLQRVRLEGPQSNKALLGVGWADSAEQRYTKALAPWLELRGRNMLDAAVQESYLAVPYAYAQLDATKQAAEQYMFAVDGVRSGSRSASISRSRRFATVSCSTRSSRTTRATRSAGTGSCSTLPDAPETRYLYHLLATHEFQEGLKNYRDLLLMQRNLATWSLSVDGVRGHGRHASPRVRAAHAGPASRRSTRSISTRWRAQQERARVARSGAIERDDDVAGLATAREREQWEKIERIEKVLAQRRSERSAGAGDAREDAAAARPLLWDFNASYKARLWRTRKELRELDVAYKEARRRWVLVERAREDYPARTEEFAGRVANLQPRIAALSATLAAAAQSQNQYLAAIAVKELESQKERLAAYSLQARFALASIYDRASSGSQRKGAAQ